MQRKKKEQLKTEAKKFSFVGIISTVIDYVLLNVLTLIFHLPPIIANVISTTSSSVVSYRLNKKHVFEGRRHGRKTTILLYVAIIGTGIYIIQNAVILLLNHRYEGIVQGVNSSLGWQLNPQILAVNLAKATGGCLAGIWNYVMLRRFIFVPETQKDEVETAD